MMPYPTTNGDNTYLKKDHARWLELRGGNALDILCSIVMTLLSYQSLE
jgi:hypothetical protein